MTNTNQRPTDENCVCPSDGLERVLCNAVAGLTPLYTAGPADRPDHLPSSYPKPAPVIEAHEMLIDALLPGRLTAHRVSAADLSLFLTRHLSHAWRLLRPEVAKALPLRWQGAAAQAAQGTPPAGFDPEAASHEVLRSFIGQLPAIRELVVADIQAAYEGDPAALSYAEVLLAYPGLLAIASHRLAHALYRLDVPVVPRIMSEWTHAQTGVDIHPGAEIGRAFFIDHATGVVIGETTRIGDHVKLYQGVTLGARSFPLDAQGLPVKHIKRHPTVEDDVVIYANATILGGETVIGRGSMIGGNLFLTESVPPNSLVTTEHAQVRIKSAPRSA